MAALPQAKNGDITTLSAYNQRAIARNPELGAKFGVTPGTPNPNTSNTSTGMDVSSPDLIKSLTKTAQTQANPSLQTTLQQLKLNNLQLDNNENQINQNYDTVGANLVDQAGKSTNSLKENQNNLGLLSSGMTAAGLGDIQVNLGKNQALNEQDKANKLADIALQRAGITNQTVIAQNTYNQGVNDIVTKLLEGAQSTAGNTPTGKTTYIPGVGYINGTQALSTKTNSSSGGSKVAGDIVTNSDGSTIKITPALTDRVSKIMMKVPSEYSGDSPYSQTDPYFSDNEITASIQMLMTAYGYNQQEATTLVGDTMQKKGYVNWNDLSPQQQQQILNGG